MRRHTSFCMTAAASYVPAASSNDRRTRRLSTDSSPAIDEILDELRDARRIRDERCMRSAAYDLAARIGQRLCQIVGGRARDERVVFSLNYECLLRDDGKCGTEIGLEQT